MGLKAALYHFTDESKRRPKIYKEQLEVLKRYAESLGLEVVDIYCDMSIKRYERTEFDRFLKNANHYEALVTKDFYHISKNTGKCLDIMQRLRDKGLVIYTMDNGIFTWVDTPIDKSLRVATYTCHYGTKNEIKEVITVKNDILALFTKKKTKWTVIDQYFDESFLQKDSEQVQLKTLINNRKKYDLLLIHNLNDVHWRTANFCKIRELLQLDMFSLKEGYLQYMKG